MTIQLNAADPEALTANMYDALRTAAHRELRRAGSPQTWQTTAIIHEAWMKLHTRDDWESREHFVRTATKAMRHIMIDAARARLADRRGSGQKPVPIDDVADNLAVMDDAMLVQLGETLADLAAFDPELAEIVDCRFFGGLTEAEIALLLGLSERSVRRRWAQARAFIHREMREDAGAA